MRPQFDSLRPVFSISASIFARSAPFLKLIVRAFVVLGMETIIQQVPHKVKQKNPTLAGLNHLLAFGLFTRFICSLRCFADLLASPLCSPLNPHARRKRMG